VDNLHPPAPASPVQLRQRVYTYRPKGQREIMTTIKLYDGDLGLETMLVRCNLSQASAPVEVDYCTGKGWQSTQYQCADTQHRTSGLISIAKELAARACETPRSKFTCEAEEVES